MKTINNEKAIIRDNLSLIWIKRTKKKIVKQTTIKQIMNITKTNKK